MTLPLPLFESPIISCDHVTKDVVIIRLEKPAACQFDAGQYAVLSSGEYWPRPYSIASTPHDDYVEFHFKDSYTPEGMGHHMVHHAKVGDTMTCHAIEGKTIHAPKQKSLFIAGGVGIAPVKAMIETHLNDHNDVSGLFWGARSAHDFYMDEWLETLRDNNPQSPIIQCCENKAPTGDAFFEGFAIDAALAHIDDFNDTIIYMFGPPAMAYNAAEKLSEKGVKKEAMKCDFFDKAPQITVK